MQTTFGKSGESVLHTARSSLRTSACSLQSVPDATTMKVSPLCSKQESRPKAFVVMVVDTVVDIVLGPVKVTVLDSVEVAVEV